MRRLVVVGNGRAADAFFRQIQNHRCDFSIAVFGHGPLLREAEWYREHGIELRQGVRVTSIDRHARLVKGDDGSFTTYDRLILAIGMPSNSGLSVQGLQTRSGIVINGSMETSDGYIYAIGGCAEVRDERWASQLDEQVSILAARLVNETDGVEIADLNESNEASAPTTVYNVAGKVVIL